MKWYYYLVLLLIVVIAVMAALAVAYEQYGFCNHSNVNDRVIDDTDGGANCMQGRVRRAEIPSDGGESDGAGEHQGRNN